MVDGVATDATGGFVDTTIRSPVSAGPDTGVEAAGRMMDDRLEPMVGEGETKPPLGPPEGSDGLGKFYFERR